jgi:hypothetical protein
MTLLREEGYTLVDLLMGAVLALIILAASLSVLQRAWVVNMQTSDRVSSTQTARVAMDEITRALRSAVCPDPLTSALVGGADNSVTFYVDLSDGSSPTDRYTLNYDPTARTITEYRYDGSGASPTTTWPATPTSTRVLVTNVGNGGSDPIFRFTGYDAASPPRPTVVLATPLTAAGVAAASRITITFTARAESRSAPSPQSTPLQDQIDLRSADPNQPKPAPQCT